MKLWVTATFVAQYTHTITVGKSGSEYGYARYSYGGFTPETEKNGVMICARLYTIGVYTQIYTGGSDIYRALPLTITRLDTNKTVVFNKDSDTSQNHAEIEDTLFTANDLNKKIYLKIT